MTGNLRSLASAALIAFGLYMVAPGAAVLFLLQASAANATIINFSSDPGDLTGTATVRIDGVPSSGSFGLAPGIPQTQSVWAYDVFVNPTSTFSNEVFNLDLTLNGVTLAIPFLASADAGSGQYSFIPNGTVSFDLAGDVVEVTGLAVTTTISDPAHAGPTQASFLLVPAAAPEPATLALFSLGLAGLGLMRRKRAA